MLQRKMSVTKPPLGCLAAKPPAGLGRTTPHSTANARVRLTLFFQFLSL
jgi:hypothetical protein